MTQFGTGYCAACETLVTRQGPEAGMGPDGQLYCNECHAMLLLLQEQRHPGSASAGKTPAGARGGALPGASPRTGAPRASAPRAGSAGARPRSAAAPRTTAMGGKTLAGIGAGVLALAIAGLWLATRSGDEEKRPPRTERPASSPANGSSATQPTPPPTEPTPPPDPTDPPPETPPPQTADVTSALDARGLAALEGRSGKVSGTVTRAAAAKSGKIFFINFSDDRDGFVAVIFEQELASFEERFGGDLARTLTGKTVVISGKVTTYQGRLQMVLEEPSQLQVK